MGESLILPDMEEYKDSPEETEHKFFCLLTVIFLLWKLFADIVNGIRIKNKADFCRKSAK